MTLASQPSDEKYHGIVTRELAAPILTCFRTNGGSPRTVRPQGLADKDEGASCKNLRTAPRCPSSRGGRDIRGGVAALDVAQSEN
jgi:hypothetical protein